MKSAVSRAVVAVSVVAALGASAACSGDGGGDDGGRRSKPSGGAAARLEKAALTSGDVKGFEVEKPRSSGGARGAEGSQAGGEPPAGTPAPAECAPLAAPAASTRTAVKASVKAPVKAHVSRVSRTLTATSDKDVTTTEVGLSGSTEADAKRAMAELRAAAKSKRCGSFHIGARRYLGVEHLPAPDEGDEAVSYKIAHRTGDYVARHSVTVVRSGSTLAVFDASNLYDPEGVQSDREAEKDGLGGAGTPTADEAPKVSPRIVDAQLAKLAR
ncbi:MULTISPECIES: hypothetical protein [unclassified Streptomyces]|uniref:hypothetical protein n=1 Tax=unclassified Streptomyces TaxID=2593676 RepID=UPI0033DF72B8